MMNKNIEKATRVMCIEKVQVSMDQFHFLCHLYRGTY